MGEDGFKGKAHVAAASWSEYVLNYEALVAGAIGRVARRV